MRKTICLLIICLFYINSFGQDLLNSRNSSYYTYIFKVSDKEAKTIYKESDWVVTPSYFHTLVDSFPTDSDFTRNLTPGYYLRVYTEKNSLKMEITTVQNFDIRILKNNSDLCILVLDSVGNSVPDAKVKINHKKVNIDKKTHTYRIKKSNNSGLLIVQVNNQTAYYNLEKLYNNPRIKQVGDKFLQKTYLNYVWSPVFFVLRFPIDGITSLIKKRPQSTIVKMNYFFRSIPERIEYFLYPEFSDKQKTKNFGYIVFNKPKYHPKDTVKLKAFIVNKKGKAIAQNVDVLLQKNSKENFVLSHLKPYNPGGYQFEFYLHDSLNLQLDRQYSIILKNKDGNLITGTFTYEDYELTKSNLEVRTNKDIQYGGDSLILFLKGTDENELPLLDASCEIIITPEDIQNFYNTNVFIPDTLIVLNKKLEGNGETEITISDINFPHATFNYAINVTLKTSDNELITRQKLVNYNFKSETIDYELDNDSILFNYKINGKERDIIAYISGMDNLGNKFKTDQIKLPFKDRINPYFYFYEIKTDSLNKIISLESSSSQIQCTTKRTKDSLYITINNPRKIVFNYFIYKLNKEINRGFSDKSFSFNESINSEENYYVSLQYLWAGRVVSEEYEIPFREKELKITVNQPKVIYPGQHSTIDILVTDKWDNPVSDVDLTAYGLTKKFNYVSPKMPYLGKPKEKREKVNMHYLKNRKNDYQADLDYNQWKILMQLDSIEYYRFIYPENKIYVYSYLTNDSITQFAPFIVHNGKNQTVEIIYIDKRPAYFSWSTNQQPYSFKISEGYHTIEIRTKNKIITIDSLYFEKYKKTIFSLNDQNEQAHVQIKEMPEELTDNEKNNLFKYIFAYRYNSSEQFAYIKQYQNILLLTPISKYSNSTYDRNTRQYYSSQIAGPLTGSYLEYNLIDEYKQSFQFEPFYEYNFSPGLLKMRAIDPVSKFPTKLNAKVIERLDDRLFTEETILTMWEESVNKKRYSTARYNVPYKTLAGNGGLNIELINKSKAEEITPLNILLFQPENPKFIRIYPGSSTHFNDLGRGFYRVIVFYPGAKYSIIDSLYVKPNGLNYYKSENCKILPKDEFSSDVSDLIAENIFKPTYPNSKDRQLELNQIKNKYQTEFSFALTGNTIKGFVYGAEDGLPIPGVSVVVKDNPTIGTTTDIDGFYSINVPLLTNTLMYSFVGMKTIEIPIQYQNFIDVYIEAELLAMDEVIVTAMGVKRNKESLSFSVQETQGFADLSEPLEGMVAGLQVDIKSNSSDKILLRGLRSVDGSNNAMIVIDGVPYFGEDLDLDTEQIEKMEVLKDPSLTAIYGSNAKNGVIIITTKDKTFNNKIGIKANLNISDPSLLETNSIRDNFSDYAFWQPKLRTDKNGKAFFSITFPDDITNWSTFVLAMNDKKQTGQTQNEIKSFKPILAQLSVPRFLIQGDTAYAIGKTLNYTSDTIKIKTHFELQDSLVFSKDQLCVTALIDSLPISPRSQDTIEATYIIKKNDGYYDGEKREIPVFKKGLEQTIGNFYVLDNDTTIYLQFKDSLGTVNIYADFDELKIIDSEIKRLVNYKYQCNEQLASTLKAYLATEDINSRGKTKKNYSKQINKIIRTLENNQNNDGFWGWWNKSETSTWISVHVIEALINAKQHDYKIAINQTKMIDYAIWTLESEVYSSDQLRLLYLLKLLNANIDYERYIIRFEKEKHQSLLDKFRIIELKQQCNLNYNIKDILDTKQETIFGNIYFASNPKNDFVFYENEIQTTLSAYKILRQDTIISKDYLTKIRNYFYEARKNLYWSNTFESSQIIETILPDIINLRNKASKQELIISGTINKTVDKFPFSMSLSPTSKITIKKTGKYPLYLTTYQNYWDTLPKNKITEFGIKSRFENNSCILSAGKPVKLIIDVEIKKDADYIMIEIPIPAGCTYNSKGLGFPNEIHREYFKEQVTIFCRSLNKGKYQFEVDLLPKYNGKYILNPTKIELMYYPTFNANNELKRVIIK